MDDYFANEFIADGSLYVPEDDLFSQQYGSDDGARLIAPSIIIFEPSELSGKGKEPYKDGFDAAMDGAYPLEKPVLDLKRRYVYSVDMVRLNFTFDNAKKLCEAVDTQMILNTMSTSTSNRIGTYRFMWWFDRADGKNGGYKTIDGETGEVISDGGKEGVVLKIGYGVVEKGGKANNKGFVEFNPNKCEKNGRRFVEWLYELGCDFALARWDLAVDVPIERSRLRVTRDRRNYEYWVSSKGGVTEYLGQRSNSGRVKVYDKAGEQGIETDLSRIELTCDARWSYLEVMERLPKLPTYAPEGHRGPLKMLSAVFYDVLASEYAKSCEDMFPEKYLQLLPKATRARYRRKWREGGKAVEYDDKCVIACLSRARSFVPVDTSSEVMEKRKFNKRQDEAWESTRKDLKL